MVIPLPCIPNRIDECFGIHSLCVEMEQKSFQKLNLCSNSKLNIKTNHILRRTKTWNWDEKLVYLNLGSGKTLIFKEM